MLETPRFIGSEIYRRSRYGSGHPLAIPRVSTVIDLARALGWLPDGQYLDSPVATPEELARFHDRDYIAALAAAEASQSVSRERRRRYNIGCNGNPVFPEIFRRPATACGGSLLGASLIGDGGFLFAASELATAVQHGIAAVTVVFNDSAYGNSNRDQRERFGGREIGTVLHNPDFAALARSFGADGIRIEGVDQLEGALGEALAGGRPALIECPMDRLPSPF